MTLSPREAAAVLSLMESHRALVASRNAMRKLGDHDAVRVVTESIDAINILLSTLTGQERVSAMEEHLS